MKEGSLYFLLPAVKKYRSSSAMFPYMKGGKAIIIKVETVKVGNPKDEEMPTIELVDFLFDGKIYAQTVLYFKENAIYVGTGRSKQHVKT